MKRIKRLLMWFGCVAIVVFGIAYFAMDYGVERALRSMQPIEETDAGVGEGMERAVDDERNDSGLSMDGQNEDGVVDDEMDHELSGGNVSNDRDGSQEQDSENDRTSDGSDGDVVDHSRDKGGVYTAEITPEKIEAAEDKITFREKTKVTSTLIRRLSASDIRRLSSMSSMSLEEKKEAKALFLEKLSEEEYDELIAIAAKLGLSRGKTYAESTRD